MPTQNSRRSKKTAKRLLLFLLVFTLFLTSMPPVVFADGADPAGTIKVYAGTGEQAYDGDAGPAANAKLDRPNSVAMDSDGNLYISQIGTGGYIVRKVDTDKNISTVTIHDPTLGDFSCPGGGLSIDAANKLYIAGGDSHKVYTYSNGSFDNHLDTGFSYNPKAVAIDKTNGNIYFTDINNTDNDVAYKLTDGSPPVVEPVKGDIDIDNPMNSIAVDSQGNIYVSYPAGSVVLKIDKNGSQCTTFAGDGSPGYGGDGGTATAAKLNNPQGIAIDSLDNVYIADADNFCIRMVHTSPSAIITTIAGKIAGGVPQQGISPGDPSDGPANDVKFISPTGITVGPNGNIYIADSGANKVVELVAPPGPAISPAGGSYSTSGSVSINLTATLTASQRIYYTTDGTLPNTDSTNTANPSSHVTLTPGTTTVKTAVYDSAAKIWSKLVTETYNVSYYHETPSKPPVTQASVSTYAATGINANTATLNGNASYNYGSELTDSGFLWGTSPDSLQQTSTGSGSSLMLNLTGLKENTEYYFKAYATNAAGTSYGSLLSFKTPATPLAVTTQAATDITLDTATVNGSLTGGGNITSVGFTVSPGFTGDQAAVLNSDGSFSVKLTGLKPGMIYSFKAFATNELGRVTGSAKNLITLKTKPEVETRTVDKITQTGVTLNGYVLNNDNFVIADCGFLWGTTYNLDKKVSTTLGADKHSFSGFLSGLKPETTYYLQAYATNIAGTGYGSVISFKTASYKPEVETREPEDITQVEATLKSSILKDNGLAITDSGFLWGTDNTPDNKVSVKPGADQRTLSSLLKGLKPSRTYYFQGYATNSAGTGYGEVISFTTLDNKPDVETQQPEEIENFKATLNAIVKNSYGLTIKERGFLWGTDPKPDKKVNVPLFWGQKFFTTIAELKPDTKYYYQAYATSAAGTGYGEVISFTTQTNAPVVETRPVDGITPGSAELHGYILRNRGYNITESGFLWGTDTEPANKIAALPDNKDMRTLSHTFSGLRGGTTYYVQAYAASSQGVGFGEVLSFTTEPAVKASVTTISANFDAAGWQPILKGCVTFDGGSTITDYGFRYGTDQKNWTNKLVGQSNRIGEFTANLSDEDRLSPGTYYVQAYAINSVGTSYGEILKFTTPNYPKVTLSVTSPAVSSTDAALTGNITDTGGADVICDAHQFQYRQAGKSAWLTLDPTPGAFGTGAFSFNLTGLDPNTKYEFTAQVHNPAGWATSTTVSYTTGWGAEDGTAAKNMKAAGYSAQKIADILKDTYKDTDDAAFKALRYAEFATNDIAAAFKTSTYKLGYSRLIAVFKAGGLDVTEVAGALKQAYTLDMQFLNSGQLNGGLIRCLKNSGYSVDEIITAVRKVLNFQVRDCTLELTSGGLFPNNTVNAAISRAYGADALADYLWSKCTHSPGYSYTWTDETSLYPIAKVLRYDVGLTTPKVIEILKRLYPTLNLEFMAAVLDDAGFSVTDTGNAMVQFFSADPITAATTFYQKTRYDKFQIEEFLIKETKSSPQDMVKIIGVIMRNKFDFYIEIPRVLKVYYDMDIKASAACMYAAGYDLDSLMISMERYYNIKTPFDKIGVLKELGLPTTLLFEKVGYSREPLTAFRQQGFAAVDYMTYVKTYPNKFWNVSLSWLNSAEGYKSQAGGVFGDLVRAGYGLTEIAAGVKQIYGLDQSTALKVFMNTNSGASMKLNSKDIVNAVSEAYGSDSILGEIKKMVSSGSSVIQIATSLKSSYGITDPEQVSDYLIKSGYNETNVLDALEVAFFSRKTNKDTIDALYRIYKNVFKQTSIRPVLNAVLKAVGCGPDGESLVWLFKSNGYTITDGARIMKDEYSMTPFQIIDAYVYTLGRNKKMEILTGVMAAFGADPIPGYMEYRKTVGDSPTLALSTLMELFGVTDAEKAATYLAQAKYSQNDVLGAILSEFYHNQASPDALKKLGDILQKVYNETQGNTAAILKAANASNPSSAILVLNKGGYSLGDIARALKDIFSLTSSQTIGALTKSGLYKQEEISSQVQSVYGGDYVLLYLQYWKSLGYSAESCYDLMDENLGIKDATKMFSFLKVAGFSESDAWKALIFQSRNEIMTVLKNAYGLYDPIAAGKQIKQIPILNDFYGLYDLKNGFQKAYPGISTYTLIQALRAAGIPVDGCSSIFSWLRSYVEDGKKDDEVIAILGTAHPDDLGLRVDQATEIIHGKGYSLEEAAAWLLKDNYKWEDFFGYLDTYYAPRNYPQSYFANNSSSKFIIMELKNKYSIDDLAKGDLGYYMHSCGETVPDTQDYACVYYDLISAGYSIDESTLAIIKLGANAVSSLVSIMVDESISRASLTGNQSLRLNAYTVADKLYTIGTTTPGISFSLVDIAKGLVDEGPNAGPYASFTLGDVYGAAKNITARYLQKVGSDAPVDITALYILREGGLSASDAAAMLADDGVGLSTGSIFKSIFGLGNDWMEALTNLVGAGYSPTDSISAIYCNRDYHLIIGLSILSTITTKAVTFMDDSGTVKTIIEALKKVSKMGFKLNNALSGL